MLWQEAKTLAKETLVDQSNMETISSAPPHGVMDAQSETDPEFTLMSHIIAAGFFLNKKSKILCQNINKYCGSLQANGPLRSSFDSN